MICICFFLLLILNLSPFPIQSVLLTAHDFSKVADDLTNNNPPRINQDITDITLFEVAAGRTWVYKGGIKQEMGSYKDGFAVHQITKTVGDKGNPDYIMWVDEESGTYGMSEQPTGYSDSCINPGGMVEFDEDGYIYYTYGGRAVDLPLDLYKSDNPFDVYNFTKLLDDYEAEGASTGPTLWVKHGKVMLSWRYLASVNPGGKCRHRRYDTSDFSDYENQIDIGRGSIDVMHGDVGIEQQWTRYDPRYDKLLASFSYFDIDPPLFGSVGWFASYDYGDTWSKANGSLYQGLPKRYPVVDMPYDHIREGETTDWHPCEIALTPDGTPCMAMPIGVSAPGGRIFSTQLYFYKDGSWQTENNIGPSATSASFAIGATRNNFVHVYAKSQGKNKLRVRLSRDNGNTWNGPYVLDTLPPHSTIDFISFFQPSDEYENDYCRFMYSYYDNINDTKGHDNVKYISFNTAGEGIYPADGSTDISLQPICYVNVLDDENDTLTVYFYEKTTGQWILRQTNDNVQSGSTVYWGFTQAEFGCATYHWAVRVTDGKEWTNEVFHFQTECKSFELFE